MITIKAPLLSLLSTLYTLSLFSLCYVLCVSAVHAEDNHNNQRDIIFPLPETVIFDSNKAALGESLFFDTRLSRNNQIACASCHQLDFGGDDGLARGLSISSEHNVVNTPSIFNAQFNFRQNWDGSADSPQRQIEQAIVDRHAFDNNWANVTDVLQKDKTLVTKFRDTYNDGINKDNIIDAIVEFEKTLITPNSRFDRYLRNEELSLTPEEIQGYQRFKELGCISCHQGINVGGNLFQKFGVFYDYLAERGNITKADYGRFNTTQRAFDKFVFKVPSLRNVGVTSPYLHDGSAATLDEAITIMGLTQLGRSLNTEDIQLIKAFLKTLTGEYKNIPLGTRP